MKERLEEPRTEEVFPESASDSPIEAFREPSELPAQVSEKSVSWLRLAYSIEFLLALLAVLTLWSEVGGQSHLDMMPWYTKLVCLMLSSWCCVRFTAGMVEERKVWNRRTRLWLSALILVATAMAAATLYYHLHEQTEDQDAEETAAAAVTFRPSIGLPAE